MLVHDPCSHLRATITATTRSSAVTLTQMIQELMPIEGHRQSGTNHRRRFNNPTFNNPIHPVETIVVTRARFRHTTLPAQVPRTNPDCPATTAARYASGHHPYSGAEVAEEQARLMPTQPASAAMKAASNRIQVAPTQAPRQQAPNPQHGQQNQQRGRGR